MLNTNLIHVPAVTCSFAVYKADILSILKSSLCVSAYMHTIECICEYINMLTGSKHRMSSSDIFFTLFLRQGLSTEPGVHPL